MYVVIRAFCTRSCVGLVPSQSHEKPSGRMRKLRSVKTNTHSRSELFGLPPKSVDRLLQVCQLETKPFMCRRLFAERFRAIICVQRWFAVTSNDSPQQLCYEGKKIWSAVYFPINGCTARHARASISANNNKMHHLILSEGIFWSAALWKKERVNFLSNARTLLGSCRSVIVIHSLIAGRLRVILNERAESGRGPNLLINYKYVGFLPLTSWR